MIPFCACRGDLVETGSDATLSQGYVAWKLHRGADSWPLSGDCGDIARAPLGADRGGKVLETAGRDRGPHPAHQLLIISDIDFRQKCGAEHLAGLDQVMQ